MSGKRLADGSFAQQTAPYIWDVDDMAYRPMTDADLASTGGEGGGAVTVADGADVTQGAKTDAAWDGSASSISLVGLLKYIGAKIEAVRALLAGSLTVTGTFWQTTQPVSLATLPALVAGTAVIGHVIVDAAPTTAVTGPLTDTQLRATPVPVSSSTLSTESTLAAVKTAVETIDNFISGSKGLVTEDNSAAILAKLSSDPATQTTLAALLAKVIAAPATEAKQDTGNTSLATIAGAIKAEDTASADLDPGIAALTLRVDQPNLPATSLNGDYQFLTTDSQGKLWVNTDALAEMGKRSNDLLLSRARIAADHLRFQGMMSGAFIPIPEVF